MTALALPSNPKQYSLRSNSLLDEEPAQLEFGQTRAAKPNVDVMFQRNRRSSRCAVLPLCFQWIFIPLRIWRMRP